MSTAQPQLPEPAHADLDSMLTRKFGREVANYFSGSPLNRVSFLRSDHKFLTSALLHPSTRFILFRSLCPLVRSPSALSFHRFADVRPVVGANPFAKTEAEMIADFDSSVVAPLMIFLGLDESAVGGAGVDGGKSGGGGEGGGEVEAGEMFRWKDHSGAPVFALDVTPENAGSAQPQAEQLVKTVEAQGLSFLDGRMILSFPAREAAMYAQARHLLDWNARNPFCAGCGQPTLSVNAGGKRVCPEYDRAPVVVKTGVSRGTSDVTDVGAESSSSPQARPPCPTRKGITNLSFPRTDPTVIMAVVSSDSKRLLLGRQKRWPPLFYSTLAGFCEPAESIEEAVRREVWEEAGVKLGRVIIHSSQPWPYPANLMIGAIGQTIPEAEKIDLGNDPELDDAKWVTVDEMQEALKIGTSGLGEDPGPEYKEGGLRLPPQTAIANRLMEAFANSSLLAGDSKI